MDFDWSSTLDSVLNSSAFNNLIGGNKKPKAPPAATPVIKVDAPKVTGMSTQTMMMIGGGVLALGTVLILVLKK